MKIFLTGGTGFIGSATARHLREMGHELTCMVRDRSRAELLVSLGCELADADVSASRQHLAELMSGHDALIHNAAIYEVGIPASRAAELRKVNVAGTANVLEAALEAWIPRVLYVSTCAVFGNTGGQLATESWHRPDLDRPGGPRFTSVYEQTKYEAHRIAEELIAERGLPCVIAQPAGVYGPGDHSSIAASIHNFLDGRMPLMPFPGFGSGLAHVEDVAAGLVLALDKGETGRSYILTSDNLTMREMIETAARLSGRKPPIGTLPTALLKVLRPAGPLVGKLMGQPPNLGELIRSADGVTFFADAARARRELGFAPGSSRAACVRPWRQKGGSDREGLRSTDDSVHEVQNAGRRFAVAKTGAVKSLNPLHTAHPGHLPPSVAPVKHLHPLQVTALELIEADRRPRGPGGAGRSGRGCFRGSAGVRHGLDPLRDPLGEGRFVHGQPGQHGRVAELPGPELSPTERVGGRGVTGAKQLGQSCDPLAVIRLHPLAMRVRQGRMKRFRPLPGQIGLHLAADRRRYCRAQLKPGKRCPQVQAGAADHQRVLTSLQDRINLRMHEGGITPRAELLVGGDQAEQPVFEAVPLGLGRSAGEDLQAPVDLDRVAVHRHGRFTPGGQQPGKLDRNPRLPHSGRPEDRDDGRGHRMPAGQAPMPESRRSVPERVWDVAEEISTSTIWPASAVPSKFTALL